MLPFILASAALVAPAAQPVKGPALEGWIYNQAEKPLAASVGLIPLSLRDQSFPAKTVTSLALKSKNKKKVVPGYRLPVVAGLYLVDVRAKGCLRLQVPVLVGENGLADLDLVPRPEKPKGDVKPISADPKLVKWEALYSAQVAREQKYLQALKARAEKAKDPALQPEKGPAVDWAADIEALAKDLNAETDADTQAFLAACYLELGYMMGKLDPPTAALALDKLGTKSPFWALNPRVAPTSFAASLRNNDWPAFREALAKDHPDAEVRAYGYFAQLSSAANKGDKDKQKAMFQILTTEYKDTRFGRSAKFSFDPDKPAPAAVPAVPSAAPAPAAAPVPPAPAAAPEPAPAPAPPAAPEPPAAPAPAEPAQ